MDPRYKLVFVFTDLILPFAVGYMLRLKTRLTDRQVDRLMVLNIVAIVPILVLVSFWGLELQPSLVWLPILGVAMQVVAGAIGFLRARSVLDNQLERGGYIISAMLSNRGVVGAISVFILYGETGFAYAQLVMLFALPVLYGFCYPLASYFYQNHHEERRARTNWLRVIFNWRQIPMLGILVGLGLNLSGIARPAAGEMLFSILVHVVAWLFLVPVGFALQFGEMKRHLRCVLDLSVVKFVATPLVIYLLTSVVGLQGPARNTVVVLAFQPTAINAVVTAKLFRLNVHLPMAAFVFTMLAYLLVVFPILAAILM